MGYIFEILDKYYKMINMSTEREKDSRMAASNSYTFFLEVVTKTL